MIKLEIFTTTFSSCSHAYRIEWAKDDKDATYLSLYQNISLQNALMPAQATKKFPKGIPCDYTTNS